ncbi:MAG: M12 family metallo-peptidase [Thiotrichaceae bacterium]
MIVRFIIFISFFALFTSSVFASEPIWKEGKERTDHSSSSSVDRQFSLDVPALVDQIDHTSSASSAKKSNQPISFNLPLPNGETINLLATEYSIMEEGTSAYGDFRSWKVTGQDDPSVSGVMDVSSNGFHAMIQLADGETVFIEPDSIESDSIKPASESSQQSNTYKSYRKSDSQNEIPFQCGIHLTDDPVVALKQSPIIAQRVAKDLKTYRLAMAATGEFTQFYGNKTAAMNAISSMLNEVNFIYERDLGIRLLLIGSNADIVFTNPNTDPYPTNRDEALLDANTGVINSVVGAGAYDIGHVLTRFTNAVGGIAALGSVCGSSKGGGMTGSANPRDPAFAIDFVAHELGHQLGATHTFNSTTGSCAGGNRVAVSAFEPGSGSSVMAYAGICGINDIVDNSLPVFHIASISQIDSNTRITGDCAANTTSLNEDPDISSVTTNLTVNAGQSFTLTGAATDPDGDTLTYAWDQMDAGTASNKFVDTGNNALFEVKMPSSSASRTFEGRAVTNRNLTFEFVVRDEEGGIRTRTTSVSVVNGSAPGTNTGSGGDSGSSSGGGGSFDIALFLLFFSLILIVRDPFHVKVSVKQNDVWRKQ